MACCGSPGTRTKFEVTDPEGNKHVYLTEPEVRIALAKFGGGTVETVREPV